MADFWFRSLQAAEAAEAAAKKLRQQYGREAEAHLPEAERELAGDDRPRQASVEDVRRALRWT